jgi:DNA-binding LacI/PurR family transcriptional regulator
MSPPMTTVRPPLDEMAEAAVEMLVEMIEKKCEPCEQKVFESKLIVREST